MSRALIIALAAGLAGCATPTATRRPLPVPAESEPPARSDTGDDDVRLGGASIVGTWAAIEIVDDVAATRDLNRGIMEQTLLVRRRGTVILTGRDRREGTGSPVTFGGQIIGDRIAFAGLSGEARLSMRGRRLLLHDPRGRTTVFARVGR